MRLHLPKALLAAVLAAYLALPSFGGTSTVTSETTTIDGVKYSGYVLEYEGKGDQQFHQGTFRTTTAATDTTGRTLSITSTSGSTTTIGAYSDGSQTFNRRNNLFILFANSTNPNDHTYGHTLKLNSASSSALTLTCDFEPITLGGIIATGSASSYTIKASKARPMQLSGNTSSGVNMTIDVNTTLNSNGALTNKPSIDIQTGGTWTIAKGKTLTLNSISGDNIGTQTIASGQTINVKSSGSGEGSSTLAFSGAVTNSGTINIGVGVNMTVSGSMIIDGALYNSGLFTNNGTSTINGSYTGTTITQTGDSATLTLASNSKVNMGSMTASFGTERDDNASGLQSYTASYTIADGGTITDNGAVFGVGGETFTGTLSDRIYTITESRYNILAGESMSIQDVEDDIGDSTAPYYINVIGSTIEGGADGTLTGVSDDTFTHGISGNGIIQVDTDTSLSYSKILDKAVEFTGSISVLGTLTGVVDSVLPHTIQGGGTVQVDENGTLSYAAFKKKASKFSGSINVVGLLSGVTDSSLTHAVTGAGAIQVDTGDTLSCSKINEKAGSFTGSINVLGTLTGVSDSSLTHTTHTIAGDGFVQVDSGTSLSYTTLTEKGAAFSGVIRLDGGNFIINQNDAGISRPLLVTENSALKLNGSSTWSGEINAASNKVLSVSLADGATSGTLKLNGQTGKLSGAVLQIESGVNVSVDGKSDGNAYIGGAVTVKAGGTFTLNGRDALGYNGGQTPSITLAGSATDGYAILDLGATEQTMQTALNLNGYAKITGTGDGSFNSWSNNESNFSTITVSGDNNEITCKVWVRQGLEVSVSADSSLTIRGAVAPKTGTNSGQSNAGFKKTGLGLLTITGDTSMDKQLQVQEGTMKISGATATNSLTGAVIVSDGATLTLAGTTTLNGTLSSVASGDDASAARTALIAITGGKTTISGGGGGNGAFAGTIRVDQGAELSITSGHVNVLTGTQGKVVVNGTLSIGNKENVNATETFYNVSGSGLITSAQTYTETTGDDGSTTSTGRLVTINLSTTDAFTGSVTATAGQVKLSGGRAENTLNTITANGGGNVVIDSSMSATTISTSGTSAVSVTADSTLTHDLMTYSGSTISGSNGSFSMSNGGTVTGGTVTQIGQDGSGHRLLNSQLSGVHFVSNAGTEAYLNNSANSLTDLTVNGTVRLTQKASVTGNTTVGAGGKLYVESTDSNLGKVSGTGTIQTTVSQDIKLNTESGKEFTGTLEASGETASLRVSGVKELNALKAHGGQVWANTVDALVTSVSISEVVLAGGMVGVYSGESVEATVQTGSLTVSGSSTLLANLDLAQNGTLKLDSSLTMGSTLTLNSGITLSGALLTGWTDRSQALTLFFGVDELILDGVTATADKSYDASSVFSGMSGYNLVMTGGTGGQDYIVQLVQSTPMPEPTTATLSLLALMGLAARRRRRKA